MKFCQSLAVPALALGLLLSTVAAAEPADSETDYRTAFEHFDQELKAALRADNLDALVLLVKFPLRINHADGSTTSLDTPFTLQARYRETFTAEVRQGILASKGDDFIFRASDVGFAGGVAWAEQFPTEGDDAIFRLKVINLSRSGPDAGADKLRLAFVCETKKHRIVIEDKSSDGSARYRVWNRPKSLLEPPDLEIRNGKRGWEGSGVCAYRFWDFSAGSGVSIRVGELGCGPGDEPAGATGDLAVTKKDGSEQHWYCF